MRLFLQKSGIAAALLSLFWQAPAVAACPGCNAALGATVGRGLNLSVLFMIAMPFLVTGSIVAGVFYIRRSWPNEPTHSQKADSPEDENTSQKGGEAN